MEIIFGKYHKHHLQQQILTLLLMIKAKTNKKTFKKIQEIKSKKNSGLHLIIDRENIEHMK